jgi:uncharacterized protein (DUF2164 family)
MKYNITETEKGFAALQTGITVFIANAISNYEQALEEAKKIIEEKTLEAEELKKKLEKYEPKKEEKK